MRRSLAACLLIVLGRVAPRSAHDIPNARVDRSIQATLEPGRLRVDYEVSLAELTLTQDLRQLVGELPGADRQGWFEEYGQEVGPLNAKGLLVAVDGDEVDLKADRLRPGDRGAPALHLPLRGRRPPARAGSRLNDTNYAASEGTSRLALRAVGGVAVRGDSLPTDVGPDPDPPGLATERRRGAADQAA